MIADLIQLIRCPFARILPVVVLALVYPCYAIAADELGFENPWIREAPPGVSAMVAYVTVRNPTKGTITILGASSEVFTDVQLHSTVIESGMAKMQALDAVTVSPGGVVEFKPKGRHLMLLNPKKPLKAGDAVTIVLNSDQGGYPVIFKVRKQP